MTRGNKFTFASLACGSGGSALGLIRAGGTPQFLCDPRPLEIANIKANFQKTRIEKVDARWFYNRKENGAAALLDRMGLKHGELDILEASVRASARDTTSKNLPNLFDLFGLTKRIQPKILIATGPADLLQDKNLPLLESQIETLRYISSKSTDRKRAYFSAYRVINSADLGAAVAKSYSVIIAIREDIAYMHNLAADAAILTLFPNIVRNKLLPLGDALSEIELQKGEEEFWEAETLKDPRLYKTIKFLKKNPDQNLWLPSFGARQLKSLGYKKSEGDKIFRTSFPKAAPDFSTYNPLAKGKWALIHPTKSRLLTTTEIAAAVGFPQNFRFLGTEFEKVTAAAECVPPVLLQALAEALAPLLRSESGKKIKLPSLPSNVFKIQLAEKLRSPANGIRTYHCDVDLGNGYASDLQGKMPQDDHFDYIFDAEEIGEDFVVYGPLDPATGLRPVIGGVKRRVFQGEERTLMIGAINKIKGKTEYRGSCSPEPIRKDILERYQLAGRKIEISADQRQFRLWVEPRENKEGHWDRWRTNPIPSATEGWSLDKNTRKPQLSKTFDRDSDLKAKFDHLNKRAETAYLKIAPVEFKKQRKFLRARVRSEYRLGKTVFTSLAINKYGDEMPAMNFHIDSGDNNSGLTAISVFNKGRYEGGFFVMPQYRCAFKVGDGDVFVGNSRKVHGVTQISGNGKRLSVVSYANTALGYDEYADKAFPPRSTRPNFRINQYQIAIPSYQRSHLIRSKVLALLDRQNIDPRKVTIFVANEKERKRYFEALKGCRYQNLVVGEPGIMEIRNFIRRYYRENTPVLSLDDDVEDILRLDGENLVSIPNGGLIDLIYQGFDVAREHSAYLWGIANTANPFYMDERILIGPYFVMGALFGTIIRHDDDVMVTTNMKEDWERAVQHFVKDGRIVRISNFALKANYNTLEGGQESVRSHNNQYLSAKSLVSKYPKILQLHFRKSGKGNTKGQAELRFLGSE